MSDGKVGIGCKELRALYTTAQRAGTTHLWAEMALEWADQMGKAYQDLTNQLEVNADQGVEDMLAFLRRKGLTVAVHNDYRLDGVPHTFWLMIGPDDHSYKGEGLTDLEALTQLSSAWHKRNTPATETIELPPNG